jgi:hypothetical protein
MSRSLMDQKTDTPVVVKGSKMNFKDLVGKRMSKEVTFMGEKIKISKLSVAEVMAIQEAAKDADTSEIKGFAILRQILKASVEDAATTEDEAFDGFPMDELSKLSNEIMKFSGIGQDQAVPGK